MEENKVEIKQTTKNTAMLYLLTMAKMLFPLLTLPYLTRVLSENAYGMVAYVKACMVYMQLIVDFGFLLSGVKAIVRAEDKKEIGFIAGHVYLCKMMLSIIVLLFSFLLCFIVPILRAYKLYVMLSAFAVCVTSLLGDFLFRGLEKMHLVTISFIVMKGFSTMLTFIFVKGDATILYIPIFDLIGNVASVLLTWIFIRKLGVRIIISNFKYAFSLLKESFVFFISEISTTAFSALNTFLIGIFIVGEDSGMQIAYWSTSLQLITAVQNLYTPISNGIYPQMVKSRDLSFIKKILCIFMPIVIAGCLFCVFSAKWILLLIAGKKYLPAVTVFRCLVPVLFFSFPVIILGWPTLGAIDKNKQVTASTILTAVTQVLGLIVLIAIRQFNIINVALLRVVTEALFLCIRAGLVIKNKQEFVKGKMDVKSST